MEMHKVEYSFQLTGSQLFDIVMYNTAKQLCSDFPGLHFDYTKTSILVTIINCKTSRNKGEYKK